jgi:sigma54-dependent transcription regulator
MLDVLLTWVGLRDPGWDNPRTRGQRSAREQEPGPILALLRERKRLGQPFDRVYLLVNVPARTEDLAQRATDVQRLAERHLGPIDVRQMPVELVAVADYREVYRATNDVCQKILQELRSEGRSDMRLWAYLSPGTPQMQAVWVLLAQSGLLPATLLTATPPDLLAPGAPAVREVDLSLSDFPQVVSPGEVARHVGLLQAQNDNLNAENRRLQAEIAVLRSGAPIISDALIGEGFQLRAYLEAQERTYYVQALEQTGESASKAARLLGIEPPAFRARAETLGIRQRRKRVET